MNVGNISILNIKCSVCRCITSLISKTVAINLTQNAGLIEKNRTL